MKDSEQHWQNSKREREASRSEIVAALELHGAQVGSRDNLRCPFHDDKNPSATLKQVEGKWFFSCHASGCSVVYDIWNLTGMNEGSDAETVLKAYKKEVLDEYDKEQSVVSGQLSDRREEIKQVSAERDRYTQQGPREFVGLDDLIESVIRLRHRKGEDLTVERLHPYTEPETGVVPYAVFRLRDGVTGKKSYSQAYATPRGTYVSSKPADFGLLPLYNRTRLVDAGNVLVVEGEWNVEAFTRLNLDGWAATTTPGGAGKSVQCDLTPLSGKNIWLWADNDDFDEKLGRSPGEAHMKELAEKVMPYAGTVKRVRFEELDLPLKGDIVDYLKPFKTEREKVVAVKLVLQDAESLTATRHLREQIEMIAAGHYEHIKFPDAERLSELSKAGYPGSITLMCAEPGAGKSFWVLEKAQKLHALGRKVKVLMLEEDHTYWQRRALAQMVQNSNMSDVDWIKLNPVKALDLFNRFESDLESFMRRVETAPSRPTFPWVAEWIDKAANEGNEFIFVDPITAAATGERRDLDDHEFLFDAKETLERTGTRLFLTTHPRLDTKGKPSLAGLAGGAAYPRFSQTVLWFRKLDTPETSNIDPGDGEIIPGTHEREIQIRKARNGKGGGANIATILHDASLTFVELGAIVDLG